MHTDTDNGKEERCVGWGSNPGRLAPSDSERGSESLKPDLFDHSSTNAYGGDGGWDI